MILCITPNAAIDRTLVVPGFTPGEIHRPTELIIAAGGKGINVARAVKTLGGEPLCAGFLAGHSGRWVAELAEREGLEGVWTWVDGETRTCVIIADPDTGRSTVVNEIGPTVTARDWDRLQASILGAAARSECVCLSGSLPPGASPGMCRGLVCALLEAGRTVWVDTSGAALEAALTVPGVAIKVNGDEAGALLRREVADVEAAARAGAELRQRGARIVVLTLGAQGAVLVCDMGQWWAQPPQVKVVNAVASGDSFLAGLALGWAMGLSPDQALRWGVAAGAANALSVGGARFTMSDFEQVLGQAQLHRL